MFVPVIAAVLTMALSVQRQLLGMIAGQDIRGQRASGLSTSYYENINFTRSRSPICTGLAHGTSFQGIQKNQKVSTMADRGAQ
jgi:hypothetical protein